MQSRGLVPRSRAAFVALTAIATFSAPTLAQTTPSPHPREALAFYEGSWAIVGRVNDDERQETCSWLSGTKGHIVCRTSKKVAGETHETISFYSYDETSREYVYHWFGRLGDIFVERGQRIPSGFQFSSEDGAGAEKVRSRFTITEAEGGRVHTVDEKSKAGGPWVIEKTADYIRTRPLADTNNPAYSTQLADIIGDSVKMLFPSAAAAAPYVDMRVADGKFTHLLPKFFRIPAFEMA